MSFTLSNKSNTTHGTEDLDRKVEVIFELKSGEIITRFTTLDNLDEISLPSKEDMFICTYQFSNGECTVTASTCAAARAGFEACACSSGYDEFCPEGETGGGPGN
jgi:hypothetical protein